MNTAENREFDYQAYMRENPPDLSKIRRGTEARRQRLEKKLALHGQALVIAKEAGCRQGETNQLGRLGNNHSALGEPARAIEFYEQALVIAREVGYRQGKRISLAVWAIAIPTSGSRPVPLNITSRLWSLTGKSAIVTEKCQTL